MRTYGRYEQKNVTVENVDKFHVLSTIKILET